MLCTSFPEKIQDCYIDYNKDAEQNLEHYVKERLSSERILVRGKWLAKIDDSLESHKTVIVLGIAAVVMSGLLFYESLLKSDGLDGEKVLLVLDYFLVGVGTLWYSYGKITTENRLKKEIEKSETYYYVKAFFENNWFVMRCQPINKQLVIGYEKVKKQQEDYWIETIANEEQYGANIPVVITKALQEKKRLKEVSQQFYTTLQESTNTLIKHQQKNAPALNQEKVFYFSQATIFETLAGEFEQVQASSQAEQLLQKLKTAVKNMDL
ncbi:MAG: hypothetical protein ACRBFS_14110 [Aureispira sp.]